MQLANRLAERALENTPLESICDVLEKDGSDRLLKSFSRRLSYLHESDIAKQISRRWLTENGLLSDINNLNELEIRLFQNIAPINPKLTLWAIEAISKENNVNSFFTKKNKYYNEYTRVLRSLAYDIDLFEKSTKLLVRFALSERQEENINSIRKLLKSLFYINFSGTHATPKQRLNIIKDLMCSKCEDKINLGLFLLGATLETSNFDYYADFEFGSRSRDYGYMPKNRGDVSAWFSLFIEYNLSLALSDFPVASKARLLLSKKFRGLWVRGRMYEELERGVKKIAAKKPWNDGVLAIKTTKRINSKDMEPEAILSLDKLEKILTPKSLEEKTKLFAFSPYRNVRDLVDIGGEVKSSDANSCVEETTRKLGKEIALNKMVMESLLPDILSNEGVRLYSLGQGLADGSLDASKMWDDFRNQLSGIDKSKRNYRVVRGFLNSLSQKNWKLSQDFLDEAVSNIVFSEAYPVLQTSVNINTPDIKRLKRSLELAMAPIWEYTSLAYGRIHESISDNHLSDLLRLISSRPGGNTVALEILSMRFHGLSLETNFSDAIISIGKELVLNYEFLPKANMMDQNDYMLGQIIKVCFAGDLAKEETGVLCNNIMRALSNSPTYILNPMDYRSAIEAIATIQPRILLDVFLGDTVKLEWRTILSFSDESLPVSIISEDLIISWCEVNPKLRYPKIASVFKPYGKNKKQDRVEWNELAKRLITNSYNPIDVLNVFKASLIPTSWSGSRAELMRYNLGLIIDLKTHENSLIASWAIEEAQKFRDKIDIELELESKMKNEQYEGFE